MPEFIFPTPAMLTACMSEDLINYNSSKDELNEHQGHTFLTVAPPEELE